MPHEELDLPLPFRGHDVEVPYSRDQLISTAARLKDAVELDLGGLEAVSPQQLASAWMRVAELRLPRKAVPNEVLEKIEDLVSRWDAMNPGGITRYAYALAPAERKAEALAIRQMFTSVQDAIRTSGSDIYVPTDD